MRRNVWRVWRYGRRTVYNSADDPASIEETLQLFVRLKQQGVAILISTHIIDVIEAIWDSAYIMDHGRIVAHVRKEELKDKSIKEIFFASVEGDEHEHTV